MLYPGRIVKQNVGLDGHPYERSHSQGSICPLDNHLGAMAAICCLEWHGIRRGPNFLGLSLRLLCLELPGRSIDCIPFLPEGPKNRVPSVSELCGTFYCRLSRTSHATTKLTSRGRRAVGAGDSLSCPKFVVAPTRSISVIA